MSNFTPLHRAAGDGDLDTVQVLVMSGRSLGLSDLHGDTPLMTAVKNDKQDVAEFLVQMMTTHDLAEVDSDGYNVLHCIARWGRVWLEVIRDTVDKYPGALDQKDNRGLLPIDGAKYWYNELPRNDRRQLVYTIFKHYERQHKQEKQYTVGISENVENPCNITITVVGHNGVGKSCFVRQIKREYIQEGGPGSTDTADFYVNYLGYNPKTGFRKKLDTDGEIECGRQRLKRIIDLYRKQGKTDAQTSQITTDVHDERHKATLETVETNASSAEKTTGVRQKLKRFFSKVLPRQKVKEEVQDVGISPAQRKVIDEVMGTEVEDRSDEEVKGFVTIYDFGGEKVFYNTHHCFTDPSRANGGYERIEFWLRSIATYAIDRAAHGKGTPPVILVGSHTDLVSNNKEEQVQLFDSVIEQLCKKPEDTYEWVWNKIIEIAPLQSQWEKPVPARWVAMEHELVRLKNTGSVIITYAQLLEINSKSAVPLPEHAIMDFLRKLNFSGSFLCFDLHSKRPIVVIQPQWIVHAFKAIITDPKFTANLSTMLRIQWKEYERSGVLTFDFIRQLWGCHEEQKFLEDEDTLCTVMETLGLLTKPLSVHVNDEVDFYVVPSMLHTADPEVIRPLLCGPAIVTTVTLCLRFDNPFIPQAVWDKMLAACIHRFQRLQEPGHDGLTFIQRGFACLSVDFLWNMIINCSENAMKITMFKKDTDASVPTGTGINLLNILNFLLQRILELSHQSHLEYQFYLHNDYRFTSDEKMVKLDDLRQTTRLQCYGSNGCRWIERDDLYVWFKGPTQKTKQSDTRHVDMTTELPDRRLSFKEISRISRYIGSTYMTFFVELGCPVVLVEQEMEEHRHLAYRSRITKIFIHFLKTKTDTGFLAIAETMNRHGMDPTMILNILDSRDMMFNDETLPVKLLKKCLSVKDVPLIADHVDIKAYFNLFLELGLSPKDVDEFDYQYRNKTIRVKITALLEACIKETRPRPTVNTILLAMQECDMDTKSLITALKPA